MRMSYWSSDVCSSDLIDEVELAITQFTATGKPFAERIEAVGLRLQLAQPRGHGIEIAIGTGAHITQGCVLLVQTCLHRRQLGPRRGIEAASKEAKGKSKHHDQDQTRRSEEHTSEPP